MSATATLRAVLLSVFLLTSCSTSEPLTIKEVEYVPMKLDISESVEILYDARPEYAPLFEIDENLTVSQQALLLSLTYKDWGEQWQEYAMRLENYLNILRLQLLPDEPTSPS